MGEVLIILISLKFYMGLEMSFYFSTMAFFLLSLGCFSSLSPVLGQSYEWEEDGELANDDNDHFFGPKSLFNAHPEGVAMRRLIQNRMPNMCTTLEGSPCIFPFVYNGFTHYKCTYSGSPTPWWEMSTYLSDFLYFWEMRKCLLVRKSDGLLRWSDMQVCHSGWPKQWWGHY